MTDSIGAHGTMLSRRLERKLAVALAFASLLPATEVRASLSSEDRVGLTTALEAISQRADGGAADAAARIYAAPERTTADFEEFFSSYLAEHLMSEPLYHALSAQALMSPSEETRERLQEALARSLVGSIDAALDAHLSATVGSVLISQPAVFEDLRTSLWLLADLAWQSDHLTPPARRALSVRLSRLIAAHPDVLRQETTLSLGARPRLAALRAQIFKILRDLPVPFDAESFVAAAGFTGARAQLVRRHGVLVLDNNGFDARQLDAIDQLLNAIPPTLHRISHISQYDLLGAQVGDRLEMPLHGSPGVNLFATPVDGPHGNAFPPDVEPKQDRFFCGVLQHELNHGVDELSVTTNPRLSRRRDELIERAGSDSSHYLRSTIPFGFFQQHPQEFFASISNMYLSDTARTLELALKRFDEGRTEPLDQFLFFAEIYSQGRDSTLFFFQDEECNYSAYTVRLGRDGDGRIVRITWPGGDHRFQLDWDGNVVR